MYVKSDVLEGNGRLSGYESLFGRVGVLSGASELCIDSNFVQSVFTALRVICPTSSFNHPFGLSCLRRPSDGSPIR
jgi:hypothetical protein